MAWAKKEKPANKSLDSRLVDFLFSLSFDFLLSMVLWMLIFVKVKQHGMSSGMTPGQKVLSALDHANIKINHSQN